MFDRINKSCLEFERAILSDHVYAESGSAQISWSSVRHPKYGIGIVAHELGHATSKFLFDLGYQAQGKHLAGLQEELPEWEHRYCVGSYHPDGQSQPSRLGPHFIESRIAEEDWSDYFAGLILKDLKEEYPWLANYGCMLMHEKEGTYYTQRAEYTGGSSYHAQSLFRALHIENTMNGNVPKQCGQRFKDAFSCRLTSHSED